MKKRLLLLSVFLITSAGLAQVNTESYRLKSDSSGFSVVSELDFLLKAGNTDFQEFSSDSRVNYNWNKGDHTFIILNGGFGREDGKTFFSEALVHLRQINQLSHLLFLELFGQYNNNKNVLLLRRYLAGAGLRYHLLDEDRITSRFGVSFFAENEQYDLDPGSSHDLNTEVIRFSSYLTLKFALKKDITLISISYLQPDVQKPEDLRFLSNNAINIMLTRTTGLSIKLDMSYDSRPADGIKKYDLSSKFGLTISFD